jgi:predicted O-methyltransferase YrrM
MSLYRYSQTWFLSSEIKRLILNYIDQYRHNTILEIGCFEGLSSVFFADHLLEHPNSTLTCVDPFLTIDTNDHKQFLNNNEEQNFDYNTSICRNSNKITIHKITSDSFFEINTKKYDFIYIDGSHEPEFITRDMINSFNVLEENGIMWMDDYLGGDGIIIKKAMDDFLYMYRNQCKVIHSGYQLAITKL